MSSIRFLEELESIIRDRVREAPDDSYTARLAASGTRRMAQKVGEEGLEVALAASAGEQDELIDETADLVYHLLVLLNDRGLGLADIAARLERRHRD